MHCVRRNGGFLQAVGPRMNIAVHDLRFPLIQTCYLPVPSRLFTLEHQRMAFAYHSYTPCSPISCKNDWRPTQKAQN